MAGAVTRTADGLSLTVRLTPRGGRDAIEGVEHLADGRAVIRARVRAVPEDGAANAALIKLLARSIGVAASAVTLTAGQTARIKTLTMAGRADMLAERLDALLNDKDRA